MLEDSLVKISHGFWKKICETLWDMLLECCLLVLSTLGTIILLCTAALYPIWGPFYHAFLYFRKNGRPKIRLWFLLVSPLVFAYCWFLYQGYLSWVSF